MTEGQDAATAPAPWGGGSRGAPAAPDQGLAGPGFGVSGAVGPSDAIGPRGVAAPGGVTAPGGVAAPGAVTGPGADERNGVESAGTGWPAATSSRPGAAAVSSPGWPGATPAAATAGTAGLAAAGAGPRPTSRWSPSAWPTAGVISTGAMDDDEPFARVDARRLETALLELRRPIVTVPLLLDAPGVSEARGERVKLLSQIDDYLLPRLRQSGAPILVALVGSTGAGKSTLMNTVVGKQVSATGIRRPTTNSPVLACHPDDMRWFAENVFLPTLPRVRQQGLAMPGRDGLLVLAASEGMPQGVAILDTPDIDSVVEAHREFAHQFLDASDLWLFVTTARRYADAAVWEMLQDARDRGAALAVALSRVPPAATAELAGHFDAMLEANGLGDVHKFIVPETVVKDAMLPPGVAAPVRDWLGDTARREDRRVAVLTQTMSGILDTFRSRVPALADQVTEQLALRRWLFEAVESSYSEALEEFELATENGALLQGEVMARWQDFAGTGDLMRTLQLRRGRGKQKKLQTPARARALKEALQASIESLVVATASRAAEAAVASWQLQPAGASLLGDLDAAARRPAGGGEPDFVSSALADLGLASGTAIDSDRHDSAALARPTAALAAAAAERVRSWLQHVLDQVRAENVTKRSIARVVSFDEESLALVLTFGVLVPAAPDADVSDGTGVTPQQLLADLFGAGLLRDMGARVRLDLRERVGALFEEEARRFFEVVDAAGVPEPSAATDLLQAGYALEGAR